MFVFPLVCIFETRVTELQQVHDDPDCECVSQFSGLWLLFIDLGTCVHACAWNVLYAAVLNTPYESLVCNADDEVFVEQDIFGFEVIVRVAVVF